MYLELLYNPNVDTRVIIVHVFSLATQLAEQHVYKHIKQWIITNILFVYRIFKQSYLL